MDELKELFNVLKVKTLAEITNREDTELVVVEKPMKKKKMKRSSRREHLTSDEVNYIYESFKRDGKIPCINCQEYYMYSGPQGGMSINIRCPKCGQGINLIPSTGKAGFQISDNIGIDESWIVKDLSKAEHLKIN